MNFDSSVIAKNPKQFWPRQNDPSELSALNNIEALIDSETSSLVSEDRDVQLKKAEVLCEKIISEISNISSSVVHAGRMKIHSSGISEIEFLRTQKNGSCYRQSASGKRLVTTQIFYYAKYLLHRHTHHSSENDSLTTAHLVKATRRQNAEILIRDLKRAIICGQRAKRTGDDHTAKGIAHYGNALIASCNAVGLFSDEKIEDNSIENCILSTRSRIKRPTYQKYMNVVGSSAQLTQDRYKSRKQYSSFSNLITRFKGVAILLLAITGPLLFFFNISATASFAQRAEAQRLEDARANRSAISVNLEQASGEGIVDFDLDLANSDPVGLEAANPIPGPVKLTMESIPATAEPVAATDPGPTTKVINRQFYQIEESLCNAKILGQTCKSIVDTFKKYVQGDALALIKIIYTIVLISFVSAALMLDWKRVGIVGVANEKLGAMGTIASTYKPWRRRLFLPFAMSSLFVKQASISLFTPKQNLGYFLTSVVVFICLTFGSIFVLQGLLVFINAPQ